MSDEEPKKVRVKVRVKTKKLLRGRARPPRWLRRTVNILFWAVVITALVFLNYWLLGRFG
jgi:hypothetical protein